jgi:hypothetical protein
MPKVFIRTLSFAKTTVVESELNDGRKVVIEKFRNQIVTAIEEKDWVALHWLKRNGVRISRACISNESREVWAEFVLPAVPFEEED